MRFRSLLTMTVILMMGLVLMGCGGSDSDGDSPTLETSIDTNDAAIGDTDNQTSDEITDEITDEADDQTSDETPVDAVSVEGLMGGDFTISVTGDSETTMQEGIIVYTYFDGAGITRETNELLIYEGSIPDEFRQVTIAFPVDLEPGTYPVSDLFAVMMDEDSDAVVVEYTEFVGAETIMDSLSYSYDQNVDGTVTVDSIGEAISGSFAFTAESIEFQDDGTQTVRSVSVNGSFNDVPYITEGQ